MRPLAVTIGEPAGIGPDIILALWSERAALALPPFTLFADPDHLARRAERLGLSSDGLSIAPLANALHAGPAKPDRRDAAGVVEAITRGVEAVASGAARALVTLPINKLSLYETGFDHPGHTEFLAALAAEQLNLPELPLPVMMIVAPDLRTVPVTIHTPLADVPGLLTQDLVVATGRVVARDLSARFGIAAPRIAVAGLNPHAGEGGTIGGEDDAVVRPAVQRLVAEGIDARGPLPADTMFHAAARSTYDAALCMYHDQALIPVKTLAFDEGVNVTLGLPFVRTSPDHGTAFDIAGTGRARVASTLAALRLADRMSRMAP